MKKRLCAIILALILCINCFSVSTDAEEMPTEPVVNDLFLFNYVSNSWNDKITITGYNGELPSYLVIPNEIDGKTVSRIAEKAFKNTNIISVTIPENITEIEPGAFYNCQNLKTINFNAINCYDMGSYDVIGNQLDTAVFSGCSNVEQINIGDNVETIPDFAFKGVVNLDTFTIPENVTRIGGEIFGSSTINELFYNAKDCWRLGYSYGSMWDGIEGEEPPFPATEIINLTIGDKVEKIYDGIFNDNTGLVSLKLGENLKVLGGFNGCENLKEVTIPSSVTEISEKAFSFCRNLEKVNVLGSIEKVGLNAFYSTLWLSNQPEGVVYLKDIVYSYKSSGVPENVVIEDGTRVILEDAFAGNTDIKSITVSGSVKSIPDFAFDNCSSLETVTLCEGVETIEAGAFRNCTNLAEVVLPTSLKSINSDYEAYYYDDWDESGSYVTYHAGAFYNCTNLQEVNLEEGLVKIDMLTFSGCSKLNNIAIPQSVEYIGSTAFSDCTSLDRLVLSDGIKVIETNIFENCTNLKSVIIPNSVESINSGAFTGCSSLTQIDIPDSVSSIGSSAFSGCSNLQEVKFKGVIKSIGSNTFNSCSKLKNINIPNGIESIGELAFSNCTSLEKATLGKGLTTIEAGVFNNCTALTEVNIPESVEKIESEYFVYCIYHDEEEQEFCGAFENCKNLKSITLSKNLKHVARYTFDENLEDVYFLGKDVGIHKEAFPHTINIELGDTIHSVPNTKLTIHGYIDSTAKTYADIYGFNFEEIKIEYIIGDVDGDNSISILDATYIQRYIAKLDDFTESQLSCADTDRDGKVGILDATKIQRLIAGLISNL